MATADDRTFTAYCAVPEQPDPRFLLFQEIFGMRGLAYRLAREGYVVLVPDMFWRIVPSRTGTPPSTYQEAAAECAWATTLDFLAEHLR